MKRLAHTQVWPELRYLEAMAPRTAAATSASAKTMNGACPPNSSATFFTVAAQSRMSSLPTAVEPVKLSLRTSGLAVNSGPISVAGPVTTLNTPGGMPARSASRARASAEKGVRAAGLTTTGQPAARAGAALRVIMDEGKFHGVMAAHTPTGSRSTRMRLPGCAMGMVSP